MQEHNVLQIIMRSTILMKSQVAISIIITVLKEYLKRNICKELVSG
jgi:hypothetical protein